MSELARRWIAAIGIATAMVVAGCILPERPGDDDDGADDDTGADDDDTTPADDDDTTPTDDDDDTTPADDDDTTPADDDDTTPTDDDDDTTPADDDDDTTPADDDDDVTPADDTIYDVQQGAYAEQTVVTLENVVVTTPIAAWSSGFFVQEPTAAAQPQYSGVYVYVPDAGVLAAITPLIVEGNTVDLTGVYQEYYDVTEVVLDDAADLAYTGTSNVAMAVVDACDVASGGVLAEEYEGVMVRIPNVNVTNVNPDDPNDYGEFEVAGCLRVDDLFHEENPALGTHYALIRGAMHYNYANAKVCPRSANDLTQ